MDYLLQINKLNNSYIYDIDDLKGKDFFAYSNFSLHDVSTEVSSETSSNASSEATNGVSTINSGSKCPALKTINCPHLNVSAHIFRKDGKEVAVNFMLTSLLDGGRVVGKLFVFSEEIPANSHGVTQNSQEVVDAAASIIAENEIRERAGMTSLNGRNARSGTWATGSRPVRLCPCRAASAGR